MNGQTLPKTEFKTQLACGRAALQAGELAAAWRHLEAARALGPESRTGPLLMLHADLLIQSGEREAAAAILQEALFAHPGLPGSQTRLAGLLTDLGRADEAAAMLETQLAREEDAGTHTLVSLARVYRDTGKVEEERDCILRAIAREPKNPGLLRYLVSHFQVPSDSGLLARIETVLRKRLDPPLAEELHLLLLQKTRQSGEVLSVLRQTRRARRTAREAQMLSAVLFDLHRYGLGLRYLQFCCRRWPYNFGFFRSYIRRLMRFGRFDEAERQLKDAAARFPAPVVEALWFHLCAHRLDLEGTVASYERLNAMGKLDNVQRVAMTKMAFTLLSGAAAKALFARIGDPLPHGINPHIRVRLEGRLRTEIDLEAAAEAVGPGSVSLSEEVQARRGSTSAAIRLVDTWRATTPLLPNPGAPPPDPMPRRIVQYWHSEVMPDAMSTMVDSWRAAPGFDHRLYDGRSGAAFLRENLGPRWVSAFRMARNEAQRSDFLRLCLLAHGGGVYADADDYLYGNLETLLAAGPGLIVHREPMGGVLGNNFLAAPPRHPVMVYAARLARAALLQRASEIAWNRTGPGLLTRAVGQYLASADPAAARRQVTILDWPQIAGQIAMHNPLSYKTGPQHWTHPDAPDTTPWEALEAALGGGAAGAQA